ncbi:MAG: methyltransferase domain-containing protein [Spirochaetales bacterium]|nr:methyltransferase domain-containing protein [Spirochaetales bacterium]
MVGTEKINERYSSLAESTSCLSCGKTLNYASITEGSICVDLGSGRGTDVFKMAMLAGDLGYAYGIDIADGMLEKARNTRTKLGIKNVNFLKSPLEKLPLEDGVADLITSNCTINHSPDKQTVFNEIYRVLKLGGSFIISDIYSLEKVDEVYSSDPGCVSECWGGAIPRDEYLSIISKAGFTGVKILEESAPYEKGKIIICSFTITGIKTQFNG